MSAVKKEGLTWKVDFYPSGRRGPRVRKGGFKTRSEALKFYRSYGSTGVAKKVSYRLSELVELWFQYHGQSLKDVKYRKSRTLAICERLGDPFFPDFTATDFADYRERRLKHVSPQTVNHEQRYLSAVFSELLRLEVISINPISSIRQIRTDQPELTFLSLDQVKHLLQECCSSSNPHTYPVALLCLSTGARWNEVESLTHSNLFAGKAHFHKTKNGKSRSVPVSADVITEVKQHALNGPARLFNSCRSAFREAYSRCGFSTPGQMTHILRHTFASHYMMGGGDLLALQKILGHGTINMTMRYAHLSPDHLASAMMLNPVAKLRCSQDVGN